MSRLQERITKLKTLREEIMESDSAKAISRESFLKILRFHINLLEEVDKLVDAIKIGDADGVQEFYKRRVDD
jgi:hypothetical protein